MRVTLTKFVCVCEGAWYIPFVCVYVCVCVRERERERERERKKKREVLLTIRGTESEKFY